MFNQPKQGERVGRIFLWHMTGKIVGEQEKPYVKGSSKPDVEETLETKLSSMIKSRISQLVFKNGRKIMDVVDIQRCVIRNKKKGDFRTITTEVFNYDFSGDAQIGIKAPEGTQYLSMNIKGYFQSDDDMEIKRLFNDIQITT